MANEKIVLGSQKNLNDIAMELTELYYEVNKNFRVEGPSAEEIGTIYSRFYETALENLKKR